MTVTEADLTGARRVKAAHEAALLALPNVTGVFTGEKTTGGAPTGRAAIVVTVAAKKTGLPTGDLVPRSLQGIPTDVIEERSVALVDPGWHDPLTPGISVGACTSGVYGTITAIVEDTADETVMLLSNAHVLRPADTEPAGTGVRQPGGDDGGGCPTDVVATLTRWELGGEVDGAVAEITDRAYLQEIAGGVGPIAGTGTVAVGDQVFKRGRTSGSTSGRVTATDATTSTTYPWGTLLMGPCLRIEADGDEFTVPGDSGAPVFTAGRYLVGQGFAGSHATETAVHGKIGYAAHIAPTFAALGVRLWAGETPDPLAGGLVLAAPHTYAAAEAVAIQRAELSNVLDDWEISGAFAFAGDDARFRVGVGNPDSLTDTLAFLADFGGAERTEDGGPAVMVSVPGHHGTAGAAAFAAEKPVTFNLRWNHQSKELVCVACQDGSGPHTARARVSGEPAMALPYSVVIDGLSDAEDGTAVHLLELNAAHDCGEGPPGLGITGDWITDSGAVSTDVGTLDIAGAAGSAAHLDVDVDGHAAWRIEATLRRSAGGEMWFGLCHGSGENADIGPLVVEPTMFLYSGWGEDSPEETPYPDETDVAFTLEWDGSALAWAFAWGLGGATYTTNPSPVWPSAMHLGFWCSWGSAEVTDITLTGTEA